jgi:protein-tyrosine kinase
MNKYSSIKSGGSLLERASEIYDFGAALRSGGPSLLPVTGTEPAISEPAVATSIEVAISPVQSAMRPQMPRANGRTAQINRERLRGLNFIDPDGPVTGLSEEFRIVKRQLLLSARGGKGFDALPHGERILVCSAHPNEGKTFCAINLALSMASEKDNRVLLVDADFAKPSVLKTMGIENSPGFMDALADPRVDAESYIIETDVVGLSILPAGAQTNQDTEYLAAARTAEIIDQLTHNDPSRIIIFDSPPALAASPASVLALHVGQTLMVVHADVTTDSALRDALSLLSGCDHVQLLLNRAKFSPTGRKFGNYYGYGA